MKELTEIKAIVSVDGKRVNHVSLKIYQRMSEHHEFDLVIDHTSFDNAFYSSSENKLALVNTKVLIDIQPGDDIGKAYVFSGLITSVRILAESGRHGLILLQGRSCTIELARGRFCQTYSNTNLYTIVKEITADTQHLSVHNVPDWKSDIAFAMQYFEDDWTFLRRICHQYNVAYHYNGLDLIVGRYPEYPVFNLTYDVSLQSLEVCSRLLANEETDYFYRREDHNTIRQDSPKTIDGANYYLQQVSERADWLTRRRKPNTPVGAYVADMAGLINQMERKKVATDAEMMYIKGSANVVDVLIGRLINITLPKSMGGTEIGTYRVYEVTHQLDQNCRYRCDFEAVPADLNYLPTPEIKIPVVNPIEVECWSNQDPLGIGRVKVKFPFDERSCHFWMPQMTPDAGGNGAGLGPVSRGYSFVSEVGDSLLVSFLDKELSQPFVMGSMFHGKNADLLGGGHGNHLKTITDKTSGQIVMNTDTSGDWGISIRDTHGNLINLHTKDKTIRIFSPESITLDSKLIRLNAAENMEINVTESMLVNVFKKIFVHAPALQQLITDSTHLQSGEMLINTPDGNLKMEGKNIVTSGEESLYLHSNRTLTANSVGNLNLKGESGTNMTNRADEYENEREEITSRCIVDFRTSASYKGEYGFDWLRKGDSGRPGDEWYANIMGYYNGFYFRKDIREYDKFAAEYQRFVVPWKKARGSKDYVYTVAVMTLLKGRKATLTLKMEVDETPKEIKYEYDKAYFSLNKDDVPLKPPGKHTLADDLVITCVGEFEKDQYIDVIAIDQNDEEQFSGRIIIKANDKAHRYKVNIVIVGVTTNISGKQKNGSTAGKATQIKKYLDQCYVTGNIETSSLKMDSTEERREYMTRRIHHDDVLKHPSEGDFFDKLNSEFDEEDINDKYKDYYRIYMINEKFRDSMGRNNLKGCARYVGGKEVVVCGEGITSTTTTPHELFHALGLEHSFENDSKFVWKREATDNLMDYDAHPRIGMWQFQWAKVQKSLPKE